MATVFWEQRYTITGDMFFKTLKKSKRTISNERRGKLSTGVILLDDNERLHSIATLYGPPIIQS